jgi:hypothetical protein
MVDRSQLRRMIDSMERALTRMEEEQQARHDAEDRERDITNPLEAPPNAPFSDSPPDMPKEPLWGGKAPLPIEHL